MVGSIVGATITSAGIFGGATDGVGGAGCSTGLVGKGSDSGAAGKS